MIAERTIECLKLHKEVQEEKARSNGHNAEQSSSHTRSSSDAGVWEDTPARDMSNKELDHLLRHMKTLAFKYGVTRGELYSARADGQTHFDGNDKSVRDMELCLHLAWGCKRNPVWMDEMVRESKSMRGKWDELGHYPETQETYGEHTIRVAAEGCHSWRGKEDEQGSGDKKDEKAQTDEGFTTWDDVFSRPPGRPIIDGYIYENEDTLVVAQKGVAKTFLLTGWDMRIAAGMDAEQGVVIRVVGEGGHGIPRRNSGWYKHNHVDPATIKDNFIFWERPLNLLNDACVNTFISGLKKRIAGRKAILISFDTLSQCLGVSGESENDNSKLAKALGSVVRIRHVAGIEASVILHHEGHTASGRARGASAIADNVANVFHLEYGQGQEHEREPIIWLRAKNVRDEELPPDVAFRRTVVDSAILNHKGQVLTTCVLVPIDGIVLCKTDVPEKPLTTNARKVLKALTVGGLTYSQLHEKTGMVKSTFNDALKMLRERELFTHVDNLYKKLSNN